MAGGACSNFGLITVCSRASLRCQPLFWFKRLSALSSDEMGHTGRNEEGNGENSSGKKGEGQEGEGNEKVQ